MVNQGVYILTKVHTRSTYSLKFVHKEYILTKVCTQGVHTH